MQGEKFYHHIGTDTTRRKKWNLNRGGILADEMGAFLRAGLPGNLLTTRDQASVRRCRQLRSSARTTRAKACCRNRKIRTRTTTT